MTGDEAIATLARIRAYLDEGKGADANTLYEILGDAGLEYAVMVRRHRGGWEIADTRWMDPGAAVVFSSLDALAEQWDIDSEHVRVVARRAAVPAGVWRPLDAVHE